MKIKLHLIANSLNFIHNKFHIFFARSRHSVKDKSEEVFEIFIRQGLVSDHEAAVPDHRLLDSRGHGLQPRPPLLGLLLASEARRDKPEKKVNILSEFYKLGSKTRCFKMTKIGSESEITSKILKFQIFFELLAKYSPLTRSPRWCTGGPRKPGPA